MREPIAIFLLAMGAIFSFLGAVGVLRMPDLFTRMHAATKSATLGAACTLLALAVHFNRLGLFVVAILAIAFLFVTAPIAAHMISRAAYSSGIKVWPPDAPDQLRDLYRTQGAASRSTPSHPPPFSEPEGEGPPEGSEPPSS